MSFSNQTIQMATLTDSYKVLSGTNDIADSPVFVDVATVLGKDAQFAAVTTSEDMTVKINTTLGDSIPISAGEPDPGVVSGHRIDSLYLDILTDTTSWTIIVFG